MNFNEPMPDAYHEKVWPIWVAAGTTVALMFGLVPVVRWWGFLAFPAYLVFLAVKMVRAHRRHKQHMRDLDAWGDRMDAHYAGLTERRSKAIWS